MKAFFLAVLAVGLMCRSAAHSVIMMPDSAPANNRMVVFSRVDGSLITSNWFGLNSATNAAPISAIAVEDEIWVSEQIGDKISRYSQSGSFLGNVGVGLLDNVRGITLVNGVVYAAQDGLAAGTNDSIAKFDTNGAHLGTTSTSGFSPSPFYVMPYNGSLLVASSVANNDIHRFDTNLVSQGPFYNGSNDFAEQMAVSSDGKILVAWFTSNRVSKHDPVTGAELSSFSAPGARGVYQLSNGNVLWSNSSGVHVYDVGTGVSTNVYATTGGRFFSLMSSYPPQPPQLPVLYDNGSIVNEPGAGYLGADVMRDFPGGVACFECYPWTGGFRLADDFTVPAGTGWDVSSISVYGMLPYETNGIWPAGPMWGVHVEIFNSPPGPLATPIASSTTRRSTQWTGAYVIANTWNQLVNGYPVFRLEASFTGLHLNPGTYWISYQLNDYLVHTPYVMAPSLPPFALSGNAAQLKNNQWGYISYAGQQYELPFLVHGPEIQNLTGTLALGDTGGSFAFSRNIAYEVKQGMTTIASGTITANTNSTALNISVPAANTGAAQLILDGSSFLRRVVNINLTGSNQAIGTATMQNGDVNNSAEVDAVDIDDVIANFGFLGDAITDVDVNGEVDAVDIDIVIANFGGLDD